jgi:hypothetical protein
VIDRLKRTQEAAELQGGNLDLSGVDSVLLDPAEMPDPGETIRAANSL